MLVRLRFAAAITFVLAFGVACFGGKKPFPVTAETVSIALNYSSLTVNENVGTVTVQAVLSTAAAETVDVPYTISGTATNPADHNLADGIIRFSGGQSRIDLSFSIVDDFVVETNETIIITLSPPASLQVGGSVQATVTVVDDDVACVANPTVSFSTGAVSYSENVGSVSVTAVLSACGTSAISVPYTLNAGSTALNPADHDLAAGNINIPAGNPNGSVSFNVVSDLFDEDNETIIVEMGAPTGGATQGATTTETITITDDDDAPTVQFTAATSNQAESGTAVLIAQLSAASGKNISLPFSVNGASSAANPADYGISASPLNILAGSTTAGITITISGDAIDELNETVIVDLGAPTNSTLGSTASHTFTINDDDATPTVQFTASTSASATESGSMTIRAQLSAASGQNVSIPFTVNGASTASGLDYTISASPLAILAGATTGDIVVTITTDTLDEDNETVMVDMGAPYQCRAGRHYQSYCKPLPMMTLPLRCSLPRPLRLVPAKAARLWPSRNCPPLRAKLSPFRLL